VAVLVHPSTAAQAAVYVKHSSQGGKSGRSVICDMVEFERKHSDQLEMHAYGVERLTRDKGKSKYDFSKHYIDVGYWFDVRVKGLSASDFTLFIFDLVVYVELVDSISVWLIVVEVSKLLE
jgi:hypothetical protein